MAKRKQHTDVTNRVEKQVPARSLSILTHIHPLLEMIDGRTTYKSYVVAAQKSTEDMVAIRQLGPDRFKVKFYPNLAGWGYNHEDGSRANLVAKLGGGFFLGRPEYDRFTVDGANLKVLMDTLRERKSEGIIAATAENVIRILRSSNPAEEDLEPETIVEIMEEPNKPSKRKAIPSKPQRKQKTERNIAGKASPVRKSAAKKTAAKKSSPRKQAEKKPRNTGKVLGSRPKYKGME